MKRIIRLKIETVEVEDDYVCQERNLDDDYFMVQEFDDTFYSVGNRGEQFFFIAMNEKFQPITPLSQFMFWASIGWQGFMPNLPPKLRLWFQWFNNVKSPAAGYAHEMLKRTVRRRTELESRTINFKEWDADLFEQPDKIFSIN